MTFHFLDVLIRINIDVCWFCSAKTMLPLLQLSPLAG